MPRAWHNPMLQGWRGQRASSKRAAKPSTVKALPAEDWALIAFATPPRSLSSSRSASTPSSLSTSGN